VLFSVDAGWDVIGVNLDAGSVVGGSQCPGHPHRSRELRGVARKVGVLNDPSPGTSSMKRPVTTSAVDLPLPGSVYVSVTR